MLIKKKFAKFLLCLEELRAPFFTASIIPILLGASMARLEQKIHWPYFWLTLIGGVLIHAGTNVINDYFDYKSGNDIMNREYIRPFTGGSRLIQRGLLSPNEVLFQALLYFFLGSLIGLYLWQKLGMVIFYLGLFGVISGFFYTAPPFYWVSRGVGELLVGVNFGVLMALGSYYVQTHTLKWPVVIAALPVTLLITAVLYINEFPDYLADKVVGKNNLVVRLGREKAVWGYILLLFFVYLSILFGVLSKSLPYFALISFITLPIAISSIQVLLKNFSRTENLAPANLAAIKLHLFIGLILVAGFLV
ncbi:MAG: 1,4-dihydroxy-2-naphthoate octaprenyltransferase [Elusimicrobiota bacterium]